MDLNHLIGSDLNVSNTGDIDVVGGDTETQQRILRRLLTSVNGYIWHLTYGAGIGQYVGLPKLAESVRAVISGQLLLEDKVSKTPPPVVTVTPILGGLHCDISYTDAQSSAPFTLSFRVSP